MLTEDMQRVVREQRLGFVATVDADGTPNLSPKGTTDVWDDGHLWFADICSPQTVANEPLVSPAYDDGTQTEADIRASHTARFARLNEAAGDRSPG